MIDILIATYNGEAYLREQIESILAQTVQEFRILARDDGSTDSTMVILDEYSKKTNKLSILDKKTDTRGAAKNFFCLMDSSTSDYVMFSDQDDYWLPNKIEILLQRMVELENEYGENCPILVYSDYQIVGDNLEHIFYNEIGNMVYNHHTELSRLLIQNYVTGCTMMVNRKLCQIASVNYSEQILMHDWWMALCASAMGKISFCDRVTTLYRQHSSQVVGAIDVKNINYVVSKFLNPETKNQDKKCYRQAKYFLKCYQDMLHNQEKEIVEQFANILQHNKVRRIYILMNGKYLKSSFLRILGQIINA